MEYELRTSTGDMIATILAEDRWAAWDQACDDYGDREDWDELKMVEKQ